MNCKIIVNATLIPCLLVTPFMSKSAGGLPVPPAPITHLYIILVACSASQKRQYGAEGWVLVITI